MVEIKQDGLVAQFGHSAGEYALRIPESVRGGEFVEAFKKANDGAEPNGFHALGYDLGNGKITTLVKAPVDGGVLRHISPGATRCTALFKML